MKSTVDFLAVCLIIKTTSKALRKAKADVFSRRNALAFVLSGLILILGLKPSNGRHDIGKKTLKIKEQTSYIILYTFYFLKFWQSVPTSFPDLEPTEYCRTSLTGEAPGEHDFFCLVLCVKAYVVATLNFISSLLSLITRSNAQMWLS